MPADGKGGLNGGGFNAVRLKGFEAKKAAEPAPSASPAPASPPAVSPPAPNPPAAAPAAPPEIRVKIRPASPPPPDPPLASPPQQPAPSRPVEPPAAALPAEAPVSFNASSTAPPVESTQPPVETPAPANRPEARQENSSAPASIPPKISPSEGNAVRGHFASQNTAAAPTSSSSASPAATAGPPRQYRPDPDPERVTRRQWWKENLYTKSGRRAEDAQRQGQS